MAKMTVDQILSTKRYDGSELPNEVDLLILKCIIELAQKLDRNGTISPEDWESYCEDVGLTLPSSQTGPAERQDIEVWSGTKGEEADYLYKLFSPRIDDALRIADLRREKSVNELSARMLDLVSRKVDSKSIESLWKSAEMTFAPKSIMYQLQILKEHFDSLNGFKQSISDACCQLDKYVTRVNFNNTLNQLSSEINRVKIYCTDVTIATADVKTLNTTPVTVLPAQGAGKFIEPLSLELFLDYESAAYAGIDASEDLSLEHETSGQILQIETTGFLDQTSDQRRFAKNVSQLVAENEAIILKLLNGDITTGDSPLKCRLSYRIHDVIE